MPATFLKNKKSSSDYQGFYLNPNGNHARIFLNSEEETKGLTGKLEEEKITHTIESGEAFFLALKNKATTPERQKEIDQEYSHIKNCFVIKISGLNNLYRVSRLIPYEKISTQEFYEFLKTAVQHNFDPMQNRQRIMQEVLSESSFSKSNSSTYQSVFQDYESFFSQALLNKELLAEQITDLLTSCYSVKEALRSKPETDSPLNELEENLQKLQASLKSVLENGIDFLYSTGTTLDRR